jgi:phenylacetic acid degradation operon negative regulatory protein
MPQMGTRPGTTFGIPRSATGTDPQHLLATLLGDYWWGNSEAVPSAALVDLLSEFGTTESSARQAIRRLTARGMLIASKHGRSTFYARPQSTAEATETRLKRAMNFGLAYPPWDGRWTVVVFSVPEEQRDVRRHLRMGLRELGFALLQEAVWITPHDCAEEAVGLLKRLSVGTATVMRSDFVPRDGHSPDVGEAFELHALEAEYRLFIADFAGHVDDAVDGRLNPADALTLRTRVMGRWLGFRFTDPELPREMLPADWPRDSAREIFLAIYDSLGAPAERRFSEIVGRYDASLAALTSHHVSGDGER